MTQFATAIELATIMGTEIVEANLDPVFVAQANLLLQMISEDIESAAGVAIEAGTTTAVLAGTWSRDLELPAGPITSVDSITISGVTLSAAEYYWNDRSIIRRGIEPGLEFDGDYLDDWSTWGRQGASWRSGSHWGGPGATILVTHGFGFATVPTILKSLALRIAARTIGNVSDVTQESLAIYSVTYRSRGDDSGSHVTKAERARLRRLFNRTGGTIVATGA